MTLNLPTLFGLELIRLHYFYSESTIVPEPGGSTHAVSVPFWIGIATGGSLPVQHVTADLEPAFLRQAREFQCFPLPPREASKRVIYNTDFNCARQQAPRFQLHRPTGQILMEIQPGGWPLIKSGVLEAGRSPKPSSAMSPIMAAMKRSRNDHSL